MNFAKMRARLEWTFALRKCTIILHSCPQQINYRDADCAVKSGWSVDCGTIQKSLD